MEITGAHPKTIVLSLGVYNRPSCEKPQGKLLAPLMVMVYCIFVPPL